MNTQRAAPNNVPDLLEAEEIAEMISTLPVEDRAKLVNVIVGMQLTHSTKSSPPTNQAS